MASGTMPGNHENQTWVRIASSVQAWWEDTLIGTERFNCRTAGQQGSRAAGQQEGGVVITTGFAIHACTLEAMRTQVFPQENK